MNLMPNTLALWLPLATPIIALLALIFAARQTRLAAQARRDKSRPFVVADVVIDPQIGKHWLTLSVENFGETLARNVRVTFDPPFIHASDALDGDDRSPASSMIFREGLPSLPPGARVTRIIDLATDRGVSHGHTNRFKVRVDCEGPRGEKVSPLVYEVDLRAHTEGIRPQRGVPEEISASLADIAKAVERHMSEANKIARRAAQSAQGPTVGLASDSLELRVLRACIRLFTSPGSVTSKDVAADLNIPHEKAETAMQHLSRAGLLDLVPFMNEIPHVSVVTARGMAESMSGLGSSQRRWLSNENPS